MRVIVGFILGLLLGGAITIGANTMDVKILGSGYLKGSWRVIDNDGDEVCTEIYIYQSSYEIQCND